MASTLPQHYVQKLDNGLEVVAIPMKNGSDVITTDVFYKVGSRDEVMGKTGIAHMLEHLNFKSTDNLEAGEFDEIVKGFGGVNNAATSFDYTHYFIKSSNKNIDKSLDLFAELMQNLNLKDEEFQPERDVVAEERRWRTDNNPIGYLYFRLFNHVYSLHPYHWTPIGFMDDIQKWTIDDIRGFHEKYYQPQNAVIVVAGDIDKEIVFDKAEKHFGAIKNSGTIQRREYVEPDYEEEQTLTVYKETDAQVLAMAYNIPNFAHEDQVALSILSELLSGGKSSRLHERIVNEKRLANQVAAFNMELKDPGVFLFMAMCNPGVEATEVKEQIQKELERIKNAKISDEEIEKVKVATKADFVFNLEDSSSVADVFGSYYVRGDIDPLLEYEEAVQSIDKKTLQEAAKKYFKYPVTAILKNPQP
ncbi:MAG: M16 family metallopeptidase [Campylobacterota bacterium]